MEDSQAETSIGTDLSTNLEQDKSKTEKTSLVTFSSQEKSSSDETISDETIADEGETKKDDKDKCITGTSLDFTKHLTNTQKDDKDKCFTYTSLDLTNTQKDDRDKCITDTSLDLTNTQKDDKDKCVTDTSLDLTKNLTNTPANSTRSSRILESTGVSNNSLKNDTTTFLSSTTFTDSDIEKSRNITKELILKKQFLHDIQKLKIEVSQKDLLIDTLKADHMNVVDDLEEKLSDVMHAKQLVQAKFDTQIRMMQNEHNNGVKRFKTELQESLKLQKELQGKYSKISAQTGEMTAAFVPVDLREDEYFVLKEKSVKDLTTPEHFNLKLYESVHPLRVQVESLEQRINLLTSDLRDREDELTNQKKLYEDESHKRAELEVRCQRFQVQAEDLRSQVSRDTYRNQNYDNVQGERDSLERKLVDFEKSCIVYKAELEAKANETETLRKKTAEISQSFSLLKQDKEYLTKQLNEITPRYNILEERYDQAVKQLDSAKQSREELYEKYLNSKELYKKEYETSLKREIDQITTKTNDELKKIKENMKEMYELENRSLRETKNIALSEQERLSSIEKGLQQQYNQLLGEHRRLQMFSDSRISEVQNEAKLKSFELDRLQLLYEESLRTNKEVVMQTDLLSKKYEALNKEYYTLSASSDKRITGLGAKNDEYQSKLKIYEKLEGELDDVVMQAAEVNDEGDAEKVLFAYGYGANIPSTAKRRMQQSVQLARRVLQLERANTSLRKEVEREKKCTEQLSAELKKTTEVLDEAQQPYNYLIGSMKSRDDQNALNMKKISMLEEDLKVVKEENSSLKSSHQQISADLERLLSQREETSILKQVVLNMKSGGNVDESLKKITKTSSTVYGPTVHQRTSLHREDSNNTRKEDPILFTNSKPHSWHERLKRHNQLKEYSKST